MRIRALFALVACSAVPFACSAQTAPTAQSIEAQLQGPVLILRGMYSGTKLEFDVQGNLIGQADLLPFSLSALRLDKVQVTASGVTIKADREAFAFDEKPRKTKFGEEGWEFGVKIQIALDPQHPEELSSALKKIFATDFDKELVEEAPSYWRPWVWQHVDPTVKLDLTERRVMRLDQEVAGFPVSDPILLSAPEPGFPPLAREAHYGGISVIGAVINTSGTPEEIRIVRPVGMGLDEEAVYAVSQYRFRPATLNGKPVPVYVNIEVSFRNR